MEGNLGLGRGALDAEAIAGIWVTECPRLLAALQREGILLEYLNLLTDQVWQSALATHERGLDFEDALEQAERELVPSDPETEEAWLAAHCLDSPTA